jgi:hypothetical protein
MLQSDSSNEQFLGEATPVALENIQSTLDKYDSFLCCALERAIAEPVSLTTKNV